MSGKVRVEGPDWEDVSATMDALRSYHGIECSVKLLRAGEMYRPGLWVIVEGGAPQLTEVARTWHAILQSQFPNHRHKTLEGTVYELLYQLDIKAGKELWKQAEMPVEG